MSHPSIIHWLPTTGNEATISSLQTYTAAGQIRLNPNLTNSPISTAGPYIYVNAVRTVSFTSVNNLSGVTITINGIGSAVDGDGNPTGSLNQNITENIAGPNNNTIYTSHIFKQINSITINAAAAGLSVGFGNSGITPYFYLDYNRTGWYCSYQTAIYNHTALTHTVYGSLTNPDRIDSLFGTFIPYPFEIPAFSFGTVNSNVNQIGIFPYPLVLSWVTIKANSTEDLYFTVVQQGIRS